MYKLIMAAFLLIFSVATGLCSEYSAENNVDNIRIVVSLEKEEYVLGEPIIVQCQLINDAPYPRRLVEPIVAFKTVMFGLRSSTTTGTLERVPHGDGPAAPDDSIMLFAPGQSQAVVFDVQALCKNPLPVGDYTVGAVYYPTPHLRNCWKGLLPSPELPFRVIEATGSERLMAEAFLSARDLLNTPGAAQHALEVFKMIGKSGSMYAPFAAYYMIDCYDQLNQPDDARVAMLEYSRRHWETPFYGQLALKRAGYYLFRAKQYEQAVKMFEKLTETHERTRMVNRCRMKLIERAGKD